MKNIIRYAAPSLAAFAITGAIALAPIASAAPTTPSPAPSPTGQSGEDPMVQSGTDPYVSPLLGYWDPNVPGDPGTPNPAGGVDLPS